MNEPKRRAPQASPWPVRLDETEKNLLRQVAKARGETAHAMSVRVLREYARAQAEALRLFLSEQGAA